MAKVIKLERTWSISSELGAGGFGRVFKAKAKEDGFSAALKLVPKARGANRDMLLVDVQGVRNVLPVVESGTFEDSYVLVMPLAEQSLRDHMDTFASGMGTDEAVQILIDLFQALTDVAERKVVHRDIKPENILQFEGRWCLADFGISRYAEATTASDTHKYALSAAYAAPERWRSERATPATDVYSAGVIAYEMVVGHRPFLGPERDDYRDQHLSASVSVPEGVPSALAALIEECLNKAPQSRPSAANLQDRITKVPTAPSSSAVELLQLANKEAVAKEAEAARVRSEQRSEAERRQELFESAERTLDRIGGALRAAAVEAAPGASDSGTSGVSWSLELGGATLEFESPRQASADWGPHKPQFDVVGSAEISVRIPRNTYDYEGRSHSLWYCDAQREGEYRWYETTFMITPLMPKRSTVDPFALDPGPESAKALAPMMAELQVAWPFTPIDPGDQDEFMNRWIEWFAQAALGRMNHPDSMPERPIDGTWRN